MSSNSLHDSSIYFLEREIFTYCNTYGHTYVCRYVRKKGYNQQMHQNCTKASLYNWNTLLSTETYVCTGSDFEQSQGRFSTLEFFVMDFLNLINSLL